MNRLEKIVAYCLMTYFVFGVIQFFYSGVFVAPFLLNKSLLVLVALLFLFSKRVTVKLPIILFVLASICFLIGDRFLLSNFFSHQQIEQYLESNTSEIFSLLGYSLYSFLLFWLGVKCTPTSLLEKGGKMFYFLLVFFYTISWIFPIGTDVSLFSIVIGALLLVLLMKGKMIVSYQEIKALSLLFILQSGLEGLRLLSFILAG